MALRRSPDLTASLLAANRANAQKSTGPRTPEGKARVALHALKHGRRSVALQEKLRRAGSGEEAGLYRWVLETLRRCFEPQTAWDERRAELLAREVWCELRARKGRGSLRTKPECHLESRGYVETFPFPIRFRIDDAQCRRGVTFWTQRAGRWPARRAHDVRPLRPYVAVFCDPDSDQAVREPTLSR